MRLRATTVILLVFLVSASVSLPLVAEAAPKLNFNVVPITISNITVQNG